MGGSARAAAQSPPASPPATLKRWMKRRWRRRPAWTSRCGSLPKRCGRLRSLRDLDVLQVAKVERKREVEIELDTALGLAKARLGVTPGGGNADVVAQILLLFLKI